MQFKMEMWVEFAGNDEDAPYLPTGARLPVNVPMPQALYLNTSRQYPGFNMNVSDQYRFEKFAAEFRRWEKEGRMPRLVYMHLPNDHKARPRPQAGYPRAESYVADNDLALGRVVELLSRSPFWRETAIVVTEDDAQDGLDHVDAHRSLLLVISPYARRGYVSRAHSSFPSILKTIDLILGLPYLNQYDAAATDLRDLFTDSADFSPYAALPVDRRLFNPAKVREGVAPVAVRLDDVDDLRAAHRLRR